MPAPSTLLLTGRPGVGKTTVIRKVAAELEEDPAGFYTEEIREEGGRQGFRIVAFDGWNRVMAHVDVELVRHLLESDTPLLATVARGGGGFIADVRDHPDAELVEVTRENRDELPKRILEWVEGASSFPGSRT